MIDINQFTNASIPIVGYFFIGLTTLALTYVTLADKSREDQSAVSMLPSFGTPAAVAVAATPASVATAEAVPEPSTPAAAAAPAKGGKKKNKKTIKHANKGKNTKNKTKSSTKH